MSNDQDKLDQSDEYQYPSEEGVVAEGSGEYQVGQEEPTQEHATQESTIHSSNPIANVFSTLKNGFMKLPINVKRAGLVAVSVLIIWGIYALFFGASQQNDAKKQMAQQAKASHQKLMVVQAEQKMQSSKQQLLDAQHQNKELQSELQAAKQDNQSLHQQMEVLRNNIASASSHDAGLSNQIQQLSQQIEQIKQANIAAAARDKANRNAAKHRANKAVDIKEHYQLSAIIDGRAWVKDQHGREWTVNVGDRLKNFGVVAKIDPNQRFVESRTGQLIEYGLNVN